MRYGIINICWGKLCGGECEAAEVRLISEA